MSGYERTPATAGTVRGHGRTSEEFDVTHHSPIAWSCDQCGSPIPDGAGVLGVPFVQLSNWPDTEPTWRPLHNACIDPARDVYGLDIETVRTPAGLLKWTAHLLEKPWIRDTNWSEILRAAVSH